MTLHSYRRSHENNKEHTSDQSGKTDKLQEGSIEQLKQGEQHRVQVCQVSTLSDVSAVTL
jgi:SepF-like predicted cell division protein (DUF552 family)